MIHFTNL